MRISKNLIIRLTAGIMALSAIACGKEDSTLHYGNATMGNVVDGTFISDQGNRFHIVEQTCPGKLDTMKRAFIICDVLNNTSGAENEYDIRLNRIDRVLTKNAKAISEIEDMEAYMNDPLILNNLWISGGYMNIQVLIPIQANGGKAHELNLIYELKDGVYEFQMRHNAEGEIIKPDGNNSNLTIAYAYASFPINSIIKEDTAKISLKWNSYLLSGQTITAETRILDIEAEYNKSSFEQAPIPSDMPVPALSRLSIPELL